MEQFCSVETNQCSREFPSNDLKQEVRRLLAQPAQATKEKRGAKVSSPSRHRPPPPPPIGPSSSYSSEPPPPAVQLSSGPPPPPPPYPPPYTNNQIHQYTSDTSSPPDTIIVPMMTMTNDCSWHETCSWTGATFPIGPQRSTLITTEQRLATALQSLQDLLFFGKDSRCFWQKSYNDFNSVVTRRFKFGHVHVSYMATSGKYVNMELACSCCCRYVCVEFNSKWATLTELQEVRATLLSFISGCEYTRPGSDALPQR